MAHIDSNFIEVYEGAFPPELCDRIIKKHDELEESSSVVCRQEGSEYYGSNRRKDTSFFLNFDAINLSSEVNVILDEYIRDYIDKYPSLAMVQLYSNNVKSQRTPPKGGFHAWHSEENADFTSASACRRVVWMVYLNDLEEGEGTTEFLEQGITVQPKKGTLVLFPAGWTHTHRGNPPYSKNKYIITGWYYQIN